MRPLLLSLVVGGALVTSASAGDAVQLSSSFSIGKGAYPRVTQLTNKYVVMTTTTSSGTNRQITSRRSKSSLQTDGDISRISFDPPAVVASRPSSTTDLDNAVVVEVPGSLSSRQESKNGSSTDCNVLLAAFRNHTLGASGGDYATYRISISRSQDCGESWSAAGDAVEEAATSGSAASGKGGVWEPSWFVAPDDKVYLYYGRTVSGGGTQDLYRMQLTSVGSSSGNQDLSISSAAAMNTTTPKSLARRNSKRAIDDATPNSYGKSSAPNPSWGTAEKVTSQSGRDGMQSLATVTDGKSQETRTIVCFENNEKGYFDVGVRVSNDSTGIHFEDATTWIATAGRNNSGAPQLAAFRNGSLAVVFMTDRDWTDKTTDWSRQANVWGMVSVDGLYDGKIEWSAPQRWSSGDKGTASWPGLSVVSDRYLWAILTDDALGGVYGRLLSQG